MGEWWVIKKQQRLRMVEKNKGKKTIKQIFFNYVLIASNRLYADFGNNLKKVRMHC